MDTSTVQELMIKTSKRFWSKIQFGGTTQCWEWTGAKFKNGYGAFHDGKRTMGAHRYLFKKLNGDLPRMILVCHSCDNRKCCNPNHLFTGTHQDNADDMVRKGRTKQHGLSGSENGFAKLNDSKVIEILSKLNSGETPLSVAKNFGVSRSTIYKIESGGQWKHIPRLS